MKTNLKIRKCLCCGAPLKTNKCEYCGAIYSDNGFSFNLTGDEYAEITIRGMTFVCRLVDFEIEGNTTMFFNDFFNDKIFFERPSHFARFTFEGQMKEERK